MDLPNDSEYAADRAASAATGVVESRRGRTAPGIEVSVEAFFVQMR